MKKLILCGLLVSVVLPTAPSRADLTTSGDILTLWAAHVPAPQANEGADEVVAALVTSTCNAEPDVVVSECQPIDVSLTYTDLRGVDHFLATKVGGTGPIGQSFVNSGPFIATFTIPGDAVGAHDLRYWFSFSQTAHFTNFISRSFDRTRSLRLPETGAFDVPVVPSTGIPAY